MSYILHIDTSGGTGTIAIAQQGVILATETTDDDRNQASAINIMIEKVLAAAGIRPAQLNAIAVCGGPGSYTGLRIGMATAKGLCYALDIPMMAHNKLTLLAEADQHRYGNAYGLYVALLAAREGEYFITVHDARSNCMAPPQHVLKSNLELPPNDNVYVTSDVPAEQLKEIINNAMISDNVSIDLSYWGMVANKSYIDKEFIKLSTAEPFYLKEVYTHK